MKIFRIINTAVFILLFSFSAFPDTNTISVDKDSTFEFPKNCSITGWEKILSFNSIYRWGLSNAVYIKKDSAPVIDGYAAYVGKNGSSLEFTGMKRYQSYYLFIDFVTFSGKSSGINSRLKIYADGNLIDELTWAELSKIEFYSREIPREYMFDGKVKIEFREIDTIGGFWGMWDVSLTDGKVPPKKEKTVMYDFSPMIQKYISEKTAKMRKLESETSGNDEFNVVLPDTPVEPSSD